MGASRLALLERTRPKLVRRRCRRARPITPGCLDRAQLNLERVAQTARLEIHCHGMSELLGRIEQDHAAESPSCWRRDRWTAGFVPIERERARRVAPSAPGF